MYLLGESPTGFTIPPQPFVPPPPMRLMRVSNVRVDPFRQICRIVAKPYQGNKISFGSGVLISPLHVLTCAHVIRPLENPNTKEILVCPAQDGDVETGGRFVANGWVVSPRWSGSNCWTYGEDFGLIRLSRPTAQGFMKLGHVDPARVRGTAVNLVGYPAKPDPQARFMFESRGGIDNAARITACTQKSMNGTTVPITATSQLLVHDIDSEHAQSGGPMFFDDGTLVAIHAGNVDNNNRGTAIFLNDRVQLLIREWMTRVLPPIGH